MIADTTFVSDFLKEFRRGQIGPARQFFAAQRGGIIRTTIITVAEVALLFPTSDSAWEWLAKWHVYRLHDGIARRAADVDRALAATGARLGENDNWIAGFAASYQEPVISHDLAFDRAPGVRRVVYPR